MAASPIPFAAIPGTTNPLSTNPTGAQGGGNTAAGRPMLSTGGSSTAPVLFNPGETAPSGYSPTSGNNFLGGLMGTSNSPFVGSATGENNQTTVGGQQTQRQSDRTLGELQDYYGEGLGSYIYSLMQTGGMNLNLVNTVDTAMINAMQPQLQQGSANLNSILGAQGLSGQSSTSALANSNYWNQATSEENALIAKNYLGQYDQGQQLLQSILGGVLNTNAQGTANQPNWMDYLSFGSNLLGSFAGL